MWCLTWLGQACVWLQDAVYCDPCAAQHLAWCTVIKAAHVWEGCPARQHRALMHGRAWAGA